MKTVKTYTVTVTTDGEISSINRTNDGFNPLELAGILSIIHSEVLGHVMHGKKLKFKKVERNVIVDKL